MVSDLEILNFHTRVERVGRSKKINWLNYDLFMKIHAICDAKNAILKYFVHFFYALTGSTLVCLELPGSYTLGQKIVTFSIFL